MKIKPITLAVLSAIGVQREYSYVPWRFYALIRADEMIAKRGWK